MNTLNFIFVFTFMQVQFPVCGLMQLNKFNNKVLYNFTQHTALSYFNVLLLLLLLLHNSYEKMAFWFQRNKHKFITAKVLLYMILRIAFINVYNPVVHNNCGKWTTSYITLLNPISTMMVTTYFCEKEFQIWFVWTH